MAINTGKIDNRFFCVVDNLLSEEECRNFINFFESNEELKLHTIHNRVAHYDRKIWITDDFANDIKQRIWRIIPDEIKEQNPHVNDYFRFSKYYKGGEFKIHRDGLNQCTKTGKRTLYTINIFLNSDFEGGETEFYHNKRGELAFRAQPKAGRAVIFHRQIYHQGNKILNDANKYLLRTDLMI